GAPLRLPSGKIFWPGANGTTAFYNPSTNEWTSGFPLPNNLVPADAPAAMLPNGKVLLALAPSYAAGPTSLYLFDPNATNQSDAYTSVALPNDLTSELSASNDLFGTQWLHMLVVPNGDVLLSVDSSNLVWDYT